MIYEPNEYNSGEVWPGPPAPDFRNIDRSYLELGTEEQEESRRVKLRELTGVANPRNRNSRHAPPWLPRVVNEAGLRYPFYHRGLRIEQTCQSLWQAFSALEGWCESWHDGGYRHLFDHEGRVRGQDGHWLLVAEPYKCDAPHEWAALLDSIRAVSALLRLEHTIEAASWWNPPRTIRVTWKPLTAPQTPEIEQQTLHLRKELAKWYDDPTGDSWRFWRYRQLLDECLT